jgi:hypothetical protein
MPLPPQIIRAGGATLAGTLAGFRSAIRPAYRAVTGFVMGGRPGQITNQQVISNLPWMAASALPFGGAGFGFARRGVMSAAERFGVRGFGSGIETASTKSVIEASPFIGRQIGPSFAERAGGFAVRAAGTLGGIPGRLALGAGLGVGSYLLARELTGRLHWPHIGFPDFSGGPPPGYHAPGPGTDQGGGTSTQPSDLNTYGSQYAQSDSGMPIPWGQVAGLAGAAGLGLVGGELLSGRNAQLRNLGGRIFGRRRHHRHKMHHCHHRRGSSGGLRMEKMMEMALIASMFRGH